MLTRIEKIILGVFILIIVLFIIVAIPLILHWNTAPLMLRLTQVEACNHSAPHCFRSGRFQWMMQRVSAVLLLVLTFSHFGLQHFTAEAVSTDLTVTAQMNDPFWLGYYIMFIVLAMYHGINGVYGMFLDYGPNKTPDALLPLRCGPLLVSSPPLVYQILSILNRSTVKVNYENGLPVRPTAVRFD